MSHPRDGITAQCPRHCTGALGFFIRKRRKTDPYWLTHTTSSNNLVFPRMSPIQLLAKPTPAQLQSCSRKKINVSVAADKCFFCLCASQMKADLMLYTEQDHFRTSLISIHPQSVITLPMTPQLTTANPHPSNAHRRTTELTHSLQAPTHLHRGSKTWPVSQEPGPLRTARDQTRLSLCGNGMRRHGGSFHDMGLCIFYT